MTELTKALAMPFQMGSLLFVLVTSLLLTLVTSVPTVQFVPLFAIGLVLVWVIRYAFVLVDDACHGSHEAQAATVEMLSPLGDARCWVHPVIAVALGVALTLRPQIPLWPVLVCAALLLPASIAAMAISGRARDALNPVSMLNVIRGLAQWYLAAVLAVTLCVLAGLVIERSALWKVVRFASLELLLLVAYAFVGGTIYSRRVQLGFLPRVSPERVDERTFREREAERQRFIDELYKDLRAREPQRAVKNANAWLQAAEHHLQDDVQAILAAGAKWSEPRYAVLLRALMAQLQALRQPALAFMVAEAGLAAEHGFSPGNETEAIGAVRYALQTGRKRIAAKLLANYLATAGATPGPELQQLRAALLDEAPAVSS